MRGRNGFGSRTRRNPRLLGGTPAALGMGAELSDTFPPLSNVGEPDMLGVRGL